MNTKKNKKTITARIAAIVNYLKTLIRRLLCRKPHVGANNANSASNPAIAADTADTAGIKTTNMVKDSSIT